jgi:hypothetical protein
MKDLTLDTVAIYAPFNIRLYAETENIFVGIHDIDYDEGNVVTYRKHGKNIVKDRYYPDALKLELHTYSSLCCEIAVCNQFAVEHTGRPLKEKVVALYILLEKVYGRDVTNLIESVLEESTQVTVHLDWGDTFVMYFKDNDVWFENDGDGGELDPVELRRVLRSLHFPVDIDNSVIIKKQAGRKKV